MLIPRGLTCLFLLLIALLSPLAADAGTSDDFSRGLATFNGLLKSPAKAKSRAPWMQVKDTFLKVYKAGPNGAYAPKSLFYLGRIHEELGLRSSLRSDSLQAVDYFQRLVTRFPDHSWADDALLRKAQVHLDQLNDSCQAYIDLLSIEHRYPKGDMLPQAQKILAGMDRQTTVPMADQGAGVNTPQSGLALRIPDPSVCSNLTRLTAIRHWSSDEYTRVVLDLAAATGFSHRLLNPDADLNTPPRLLIDLNGTLLSPESQKEIAVGDGILRQVRTGQFSPTQSRVVLDIQSLDDYRIFALDNPFRIVVDVYAAKPAAPPAVSQEQVPRPIPSPDTKYVLDKDSKALAGSLVEQLGLTIKTVLIDPGHGGKDPGAMSGPFKEKDINLAMGRILGKLLEEKGFNVLYTRDSDVFIPLEERTAIANAKKADLFVSIHVNAHRDKSIRGLELYYLNLAKSKDAVRVAARENAVSEKKISDLQVILTDLMLNSKIRESKDLASNVRSCAVTHTKRVYNDLLDHGVREAPFYVLMGAKMPAILVELGYITNQNERKRLLDKSYLERLAQGLTNGILAYKKQIESYASLDLP